MEALLTIVKNHVISVFVPARIQTLSFMPQILKNLGLATTEFLQYASEIIAKERISLGSNSLLGALVKAADDEKQSLSLSEEEITGNLFNTTLVGFDTTASTMAYAIMVLAMRPEMQDWIFEEVDRVTALHPAAAYETTFPLVTRCLALMAREAPAFSTLKSHITVFQGGWID